MIRKKMNGVVYEFDNIAELIAFEKYLNGKKDTKTEPKPEPEKEKVIVFRPVKEGRRKNRKKEKARKYKETINLALQKDLNFTQAFEKVFGRKASGQEHTEAKKYGYGKILPKFKRKSKKKLIKKISKKTLQQIRKEKDKKYREIIQLCLDKNLSFQDGFEQVFGRKAGGDGYKEAKKYGYGTLIPKYVRPKTLTKKPRKKKEVVVVVKKERKMDLVSQRLKFIHQRVKYILKDHPRMKYETAFKRASEEWKDRKLIAIQKAKKKKIEITTKDLEMPHIYPLTTESMTHFEKYLSYIIANKSKIIYNEVRLVGQTVLGEWTGRIWHEFCEQFMLNSKKICKAFNVTGKFVHTRNSQGFEEIHYQG